MLAPKKVKYRKQLKGRRRGTAQSREHAHLRRLRLSRPPSRGWITARQIEAARVAMTRHIKRGGKIWIRMFPDKPITKKPAETRMGKGKGAPEEWVAVVSRAVFSTRWRGSTRPRRGRRSAWRRTSCRSRRRFLSREA